VLGIGGTNVMVGGRGVHVAYPCNKHKGAPATFFLNLHGTMPNEAQKLYQVGYFSGHTLVDSHNLIMVAPKAVGSQWGREDGGADIPHLLEVIEWVYANFKDFDIRSMWVGGHSWGGGFTASFGCRPEIADKVKGLVLMSGGGVSSAACASKVAMIITTAEGDGRMPADQTMLATSHGCGPAKNEMILMNNHTSWPMCQPGFVHANYYMLGKEHATFMDAEVVKSIGDWIKLARP
jgi:pimeloyl-ACP methyl ester carboxylesterase